MQPLTLNCTRGEEGLWCIVEVDDAHEGWTPPLRVYLKGGGHKAEYRKVEVPDDYIGRMRVEYAGLQLKIRALEAWIKSDNYRNLHIDEQEDQREQLVLMKQYSEILDRRLVRAAPR